MTENGAAPDGAPPRDVVLAGIPRSGSTLVCHLLNALPDAVALAEPFSLAALRGRARGAGARERVLRGIDAFFADARASLLARGEAPSKQRRGELPDNPVGDAGGGAASARRLLRRLRQRARGGAPLRRAQVSPGRLRVAKPLAPGFLLCVKHPSLFTSLLEALAERHPCYATVRNPAALLGSWNSVEFAVSAGHSRAAERLDPALARALRRCGDRGERQLRLLDWYFARIARALPPERVLRYEALVASGGAEVARIAGGRPPEARPLASRNASEAYDRGLVLRLGERLLARGGAWTAFYPSDSVARLLGELARRERVRAGHGALPVTAADAPGTLE